MPKVLSQHGGVCCIANATVTGDDRRREFTYKIEGRSPDGWVALERKRSHPEEAKISRKKHVCICHEQHEIATRVSRYWQDLYAVGELRRVADNVGDRPGSNLG